MQLGTYRVEVGEVGDRARVAMFYRQQSGSNILCLSCRPKQPKVTLGLVLEF